MKNIIKILLRVTFVLGYFITKTFKNKKNVKPDKNKNVKTFFFTLMYSVISSLRLRSILHRLPRSTDLPSDASQASSAGAHLCVDFMFYYCRQRIHNSNSYISPSTSFPANTSHRRPSFFFFGIHYMDSPDCLLFTSEHIRLYFLVFLFYTF